MELSGNTVGLLSLAVVTAFNGILDRIAQKARTKTLESIKETGEATHTLSNSSMGAQLKLNVVALRTAAVALHRLAVQTKADADIAAAKAADVAVHEAESILEIHLQRQAQVDAVTTPPPRPS